MKECILDNPGKGLTTFKSYEITSPWRLGFVRKNVSKSGVRTEVGFNLLNSGLDPGIRFDYNKEYRIPFWKLKRQRWKIFRKRTIKFTEKSEKAEGVAPINGKDLDDLKDRLSGEWLHG